MTQYSYMWQDAQEFASMIWASSTETQQQEEDQDQEAECTQAIAWCYE